jgi:type III restriction enzyme
VMVSFRTHHDQTLIAQLIGRMVRTPLSRRVTTSDFLNSVCLYLPFFDSRRVADVVKYLTNPDPDVAFPVEVEEGATLEQWSRRGGIEDIFERAATIPSYSLERVAKLSNGRRLIRLGRALAYDKIEAKAAAGFKGELVKTLLSERTRLARKKAFKEHLAASGKIDIRVVDVAYGSDAAPDMSHESLTLLTQNIDDLFAQSGRRFGEGLHLAYVKARVNGSSAPTPTQAKLEAVALAHEQPTYDRVEKAAGEHFDKTVRKHQAAIRKLPDERQAVYRRLRRQAVKPAAEELVLRQSIQARREGTAWPLHLYADKDGQFTCALNSWETQLLQEELARKGVVGWLRNIPRKDWSLTIPYDHRGETRPFYPDFLIFRREHDDIVVDIMEPHSLSFEDAADKAVGLATFASLHGDAFSKIELIIKEQQKLARLDVNDPDVRKRVLAVEGNQHLRDIVLAS